jgi:serine/threonine-protein kinase 24/25/MST4
MRGALVSISSCTFPLPALFSASASPLCSLDTDTNEVVAIKVINLEEAEDEIDEIRSEITMLSECHSAYVTRYITSYTSGAELCIVMELLAGGSVHDLLQGEAGGPLEEQYVAVVTRELLKACEYMHSSGKIHRGSCGCRKERGDEC